MINSFTILLSCTPLDPPIEPLLARICFYLSPFVRILSFFMRTLFHLWQSLLFHENSSFSVRIYVFMKISNRMILSKTNLLSTKHDNDILLISYVPGLCFFLWILFILCLTIFLLLNPVATFTPFAVLNSLLSIFL